MEAKNIQEVWRTLCINFTPDSDKIESMWQEISTAYQEPVRAYHTLYHIEELIATIENYSTEINNKSMVLFTAFFHDIVYIPGSSTNERDSAAIAVKRMNDLHVPEGTIHDTKELILLTKSHSVVSSATTSDMLLFLDMDLSIIGSSPEKYTQYCDNVRREFKAFPDFLFKKGRRRFLKSLLRLPLIFHTTLFRNKCEVQARVNMLRELYDG